MPALLDEVQLAGRAEMRHMFPLVSAEAGLGRELEYPVAFWREHGGAEVDFVVETREGLVAIEVKSANRWDSRFGAGNRSLREKLGKGSSGMKAFGVFTGPRALVADGIRVLPWKSFLEELWGGAIVG